MIGGLIGTAFGMLQNIARRKNEQKEKQGEFKNGWSLMPGSGARVAYLLVTLVVIQIICPMLFKARSDAVVGFRRRGPWLRGDVVPAIASADVREQVTAGLRDAREGPPNREELRSPESFRAEFLWRVVAGRKLTQLIIAIHKTPTAQNSFHMKRLVWGAATGRRVSQE